jgi:small subunit ribosomal protein S2
VSPRSGVGADPQQAPISPAAAQPETGKRMAIPIFSMRQLLEAGVHFGHHTRRWNPKMAPYIFGVRNGIHIIDLEQTDPMLHQGLQVIRDVVAGGGRVLLVGTKRQAQEPVAEAAKRCGQYYVNYRWLGGMLTNFKTISQSIKRLRELEERISQEQTGLTKRELLELTRDRDKLERALGGIKEMGGLPDILFVIDTNKEAIAASEANTLRIPVVAILDSNSSPDGIAYPIPGNDDAMRAIHLYCDLVSGAVLDGLQAELAASGVDIGARADIAQAAISGQSPDEFSAEELARTDGEPASDAEPGTVH